ncbi:MAG: hypothetical protein GC181_03970 [Bacteroidetes bacterium]|nr:hypothetical protein [Bacteroidota bacterium]
MKKIVLTLFVALFVSGSFMSCKDDGETSTTNTSTGKLTDSDKKKLYDKVWYSTSSSGGIEHEFLSDNTLRLSLSLEGRWYWQNNGDTMNISDPSGSKYKYLFTSITDHNISFKNSVDNYAGTYTYKDSK